MATLPASNTFEGGTDGSAITVANSGGASGTPFDVMNDASALCKFSSTTPPHGSLCMSITQPVGGNVAANGQWTFTQTTRLYGRVYFRLSAVPAAAWPVFSIFDNATTPVVIVTFRANATAHLTAVNNSNVAYTNATATGTLAANTLYRLEFDLLPSTTAGDVQWSLYAGDSTTAIESHGSAAGATAMTGNGTIGSARVGIPGASAPASTTTILDDAQVNSTARPGPSGRTMMQLRQQRIVQQAVMRGSTW